MKKCMLIVIAGMLFVGQNVLFAGDAPRWVTERPVNPFYFIGIGSAPKSEQAQDYRQAAKELALQDLSSEIQVQISSEMLHSLSESAGVVEEDLKSQIKSTTRANLEGFELVDAWEGPDFYWVYYRLSRDVYQKQRAERRTAARYLAFDFYRKGQDYVKSANPAEAIGAYVQGLGALNEFVGEALEVDYKGQKILVQNSLLTALQSQLSTIQLKVEQPQFSATAGKGLKNPLRVQALTKDGSGQTVPVTGLPLEFRFIRGSGELVPVAQTAADGWAACPVASVSVDKMQIIESRLKLDDGALLVQKLTRPTTRFILMVSGVRVFVQASELNLGQPVELLQVEPKLKNGLAEKGLAFTDDLAAADILIELKVASRKGAQVYNLYSAFADMNISVTDLRDGNEVYKQSFNNIKGIQLDFEKAGLTALQAAGKKVEQILPEIIKPLQK